MSKIAELIIFLILISITTPLVLLQSDDIENASVSLECNLHDCFGTHEKKLMLYVKWLYVKLAQKTSAMCRGKIFLIRHKWEKSAYSNIVQNLNMIFHEIKISPDNWPKVTKNKKINNK